MSVVRESNGPDKLKNKYACYLHHLPSGIRTFESGILTDFNCCCDKCLYSTAKPQWLSANWYVGDGLATTPSGFPANHCCKCNPQLLFATWQADNPEDNCGTTVHRMPMPLRYRYDQNTGILGSQLWAEYSANIGNRTLKLTSSNFDIHPSGSIIQPIDSSGCRWTLFLSNGINDWSSYSKDVIAINHGTSTCLGVPSIEISGVTEFQSSGGTISLHNYDAVKVPFQHRSDMFVKLDYPTIYSEIDYGFSAIQSYSEAQRRDDTVLVPTGVISPPYIDSGWDAPFINATGGNWIDGQQPTGVIPYSPACSELPKVLCVTEYNVGSGIDRKIYREFIYDSGFFPTQRLEFHPDYTGIESFTTGVAIARWKYDFIGTTGLSTTLPTNELENKYVYLYETYVEKIKEYSGNASLAMSSGSPNYIFIPNFNGNPLPIGKDDHVWPGGPYYSHPAIHFQDYNSLSDIQLRTENEYFYWDASGASPSGASNDGYTSSALWLGGFDYSRLPDGDNPNNRSTLRYKFGSGTPCSCETSSYATNTIGLNNNHYCFVRPGKCSCWQYFCSDSCRCLPKNMCYQGFTVDFSGTAANYYSGSAGWDAQSKSWVDSGSGIAFSVKNNGNGFVAGIAGESYTRYCNIEPSGTSHPLVSGYNFSGNRLTCDIIDMNFTFSDTIYNGVDPVSSSFIYLTPSIGPCGSKSYCDEATPCYDQCGSHPDSIVLDFVGYDEENPDEVTCEASITLHYYEILLPTVIDNGFGNNIALETECGYRGFNCGREFLFKGNVVGGFELQIIDIETQTSCYITSEDDEFSGGWTQSCNPYYGSGVWNGFPPEGCWCCNEAAVVAYYELTITEGQ